MRTDRQPRRLASLLLAGLAIPAGLAAAPTADAPCRAPAFEAEAPDPDSCRLALVGALEVTADGGLGQVAVHGDVAAVVRRDEGIVTLVDLSDPENPTALGSYDGGTGVGALDHPLDGDVAFSADGTLLFHARQTSDMSNEGLHVLDVSDPTAPTRVDLHLQGGMLRVASVDLGGFEVVATQDAIGGLTLFEVLRTPVGARVVPLWVDPLPALKVGGPASAGLRFHAPDDGPPLLFATDGTTGLTVFDLSDHHEPVAIARRADEGLADLELVPVAGPDGEDRLLLVAATEYWFGRSTPPELVVLDVTDPAAPTDVARLRVREYDGDRAWKLGGLALLDGELFAAHGHAGLVALDPATGTVLRSTTDLGAPNAPSQAFRALPWYAMDVLPLGGDRVLVTDAVTGELRVFSLA